jgi:hypothetical protein
MEGNRNKLWIAVLFIITLTACTTAKKYTFYYTNPLMSLTFRDTHIVHDGTRYYAVGTCTPVWGGQNPGVKLFVSDDLVNWHFDHLLIDASRLDSNVWSETDSGHPNCINSETNIISLSTARTTAVTMAISKHRNIFMPADLLLPTTSWDLILSSLRMNH